MDGLIEVVAINESCPRRWGGSIQFVKQLPVETDLPIRLPVWKIAENTGFSGEDYLSKVFRRAAKSTLVQCRPEHRATQHRTLLRKMARRLRKIACDGSPSSCIMKYSKAPLPNARGK
jgi:hypothetical protein